MIHRFMLSVHQKRLAKEMAILYDEVAYFLYPRIPCTRTRTPSFFPLTLPSPPSLTLSFSFVHALETCTQIFDP